MALSDDEIRANVVDEHCRVGWPRFLSKPSEFIPHGVLISDISAIQTILRPLTDHVNACCYVGKVVIVGGNRPPVSTLRLVVGAKKESVIWTYFLVQLVRATQDLKTCEGAIFVEIVEGGFPQFAPVGAGHPALDGWENSLAPAVMGILKKSSLLWQGLTLVRFGSSYCSDAPITMLIEASDAEDPRWEAQVTLSIKAKIQELRAPVRYVSVWQTLDMRSIFPCDFNRNLFSNRWLKEPVIFVGDGIAPEDSLGSVGTVGEMVELQDVGGDKTLHLLTNFHVINNASLAKGKRNMPHLFATDTCTVLASDSPSTPLKSHCFTGRTSSYPVKVPADLDTTVALNTIDRTISTMEKTLQMYRREPVSIEDEERYLSLMKHTQDVIDSSRNLRKIVLRYKSFPGGSIRATSGQQHHVEKRKNYALDWALINIERTRWVFPSNYKYAVAGGNRNVNVEGPFSLPSWVPFLLPQTFTTHIQEINEVVKLGRITGWSAGLINHATYFWKPIQDRGAHVDKKCGREDPVLSCIQIVPPVYGNAGQARPLGGFASGGDCGSVVKDWSNGSWVGLLIGAHPLFRWGLMTPIAKVLKSIEDVTGETVTEPQPINTSDMHQES